MPQVQNQSPSNLPDDLRREMTARIVKNLKQVQEYLAQLEQEIEDPAYTILTGDRDTWRERRNDLQAKVDKLQDMFDDFYRSLEGDSGE